ncbi:MAG: FliM/FliN family flagellar motor switch protein [Rhodobacteraceae bacterium]|nr:FliM/FliN family flagellar motor switch protein [Paracoccaceae bacterium]
MPAANVLSKKLRQGGVARSPLPDGDVIGETFARGVEDRLRPLVKTALAAEVAVPRVTRLSEATKGVAAPALLAVVDIEDADTPGLIAADADLAYHLIDLTLGGDPMRAPPPVARGLTAIDMALGRLYLEAILAAFGAAIGAGFGRPLTKAMRIRDQRQNAAQLRLAPDYIDVLVIRLSLTLAEAGRRGACELILPLSALDVIRASIEARATQAARERPNDLWKTLMRRAAAAAPVAVDAVLHRQNVSLAALQDMKVGQVIEIPRQAAETIQLTIAQPGGRTALIATGRLGGFQDNKVVKLETAVDRRLILHVGRALRPAPEGEAEPQPAGPEPEAAQAVI